MHATFFLGNLVLIRNLAIKMRFVLLIAVCLCCINAEAARRQKVIVLVIGGYRYDYSSDPKLKFVKRFSDEGVVAPFVFPVYPSLSCVNRYSMITGLYAENHGIVGDVMYDQNTNDFYEPFTEKNTSKSSRWHKAEPIWTTAEKQGVETALYWWPGCEIMIDGVHPTICELHRDGLNLTNFKLDLLERIDDIIQMFQSDELKLALIYYDFVEKSGLAVGPDSREREHALQTIDDVLEQLTEKIDHENLQNEVNVLVVSDSGISNINEKVTSYIDINNFKENIRFQLMFGALSMILPVPGKEDKLFADLKHADIKGLIPFKKADIPIEYHLKGSNRVLPILLQAQEGYFINPLTKENSLKQDDRVKGPDYKKFKAISGYNSATDKNMRTAFFAKGPAFRQGFVTNPLSSVDIYNIICYALRIKGLPNNGSQIKTEQLFLNTDDVTVVKSAAASMETYCCLIILLMMCLLKL